MHVFARFQYARIRRSHRSAQRAAGQWCGSCDSFHTVNPEEREPNNTPKIVGAVAVALMVGAAGCGALCLFRSTRPSRWWPPAICRRPRRSRRLRQTAMAPEHSGAGAGRHAAGHDAGAGRRPSRARSSLRLRMRSARSSSKRASRSAPALGCAAAQPSIGFGSGCAVQPAGADNPGQTAAGHAVAGRARAVAV